MFEKDCPRYSLPPRDSKTLSFEDISLQPRYHLIRSLVFQITSQNVSGSEEFIALVIIIVIVVIVVIAVASTVPTTTIVVIVVAGLPVALTWPSGLLPVNLSRLLIH